MYITETTGEAIAKLLSGITIQNREVLLHLSDTAINTPQTIAID